MRCYSNLLNLGRTYYFLHCTFRDIKNNFFLADINKAVPVIDVIFPRSESHLRFQLTPHSPFHQHNHLLCYRHLILHYQVELVSCKLWGRKTEENYKIFIEQKTNHCVMCLVLHLYAPYISTQLKALLCSYRVSSGSDEKCEHNMIPPLKEQLGNEFVSIVLSLSQPEVSGHSAFVYSFLPLICVRIITNRRAIANSLTDDTEKK